MAIRVTINCWECHGALVLTSDIVALFVANKPGCSHMNRLSYPCRFCKAQIKQPVPQHIIMQLTSVGTVVNAIDVPSEVVEAYPEGPAFSHDDLLDFHYELERVIGVGDATSRGLHTRRGRGDVRR